MNNIIPIHPKMIPMRNIEIIEEGDRLFYELGYKRNLLDISYGDNWIRTGKFKEIDNVNEFIMNDKLIHNKEYLEHHNFMVLK